MVDVTLLETRGLVKKYSGRTVVNEVNISVAQRSVVGLLGRNGAGKTTTFKSIIGIVPPKSGKISYKGVSIEQMRDQYAEIPRFIDLLIERVFHIREVRALCMGEDHRAAGYDRR